MFPLTLEVFSKAIHKQILAILRSKKASSVLRINTLLFKLLKAISKPIAKAIVVVTNTYYSLGFFPKVFKTV